MATGGGLLSVDDGEGLGLCVGVELGVGPQEGIDSHFAICTQREAVLIDIEVDMLTHDGLVHFLGMGFNIGRKKRVVGEREFEAFSDELVDPGRKGPVTAECNSAQRDGRTCFILPEFAEVEEAGQAFLGVREAVLVNDHAAVHLAAEHGLFYPGEDHESFVTGVWEREGEEQVRRGPFAGDGNRRRAYISQGYGFARDKQRTNSFTERAAGVKQLVVVQDQRQYPVAYFGDIKAPLKCPLIEGLHIFQCDVKVQAVGIDLFVDEGIEYEGVVWTWAKTESEGHALGLMALRMLLSCRFSSSNNRINRSFNCRMARGIFHFDLSRIPISFDMDLICRKAILS